MHFESDEEDFREEYEEERGGQEGELLFDDSESEHNTPMKSLIEPAIHKVPSLKM